MYKKQKPICISSIKRGIYSKNIGESPWDHYRKPAWPHWSLDFLPLFFSLFVPFPSLQTSFLHKGLSLFDPLISVWTLPLHGPDWGLQPQSCMTGSALHSVSLCRGQTAWLILYPVSHPSSHHYEIWQIFWHFLFASKFRKTSCLQRFSKYLPLSPPQGHSNGLSCMWDFRMVAFVLDAILSVKISP